MFWSTPCSIISSQIAVCSNPAVGHLKPMSSSSCRSGSSALSYSLQTYQTMLKRSEWRFICTTSPSTQGLQGTIEFLFEQLQFGPHQVLSRAEMSCHSPLRRETGAIRNAASHSRETTCGVWNVSRDRATPSALRASALFSSKAACKSDCSLCKSSFSLCRNASKRPSSDSSSSPT